MFFWIKNLLLTKLNSGILETEVITEGKNGVIYLGGNPITQAELKQLKEEAFQIENSRVWKIFFETVKSQAIDKGMYQSTNWEHVLTAKMMIHSLGVLKNILKAIQR